MDTRAVEGERNNQLSAYAASVVSESASMAGLLDALLDLNDHLWAAAAGQGGDADRQGHMEERAKSGWD